MILKLLLNTQIKWSDIYKTISLSFNDMNADMLSNKKNSSIVTELLLAVAS